jgi:translation initiation factor IF-1
VTAKGRKPAGGPHPFPAPARSAEEGGGTAFNARVVEALPNALYRVELEDERRSQVTVHVAGAGLLRLLPGDRVVVELASYDAARGRVVRRRT